MFDVRCSVFDVRPAFPQPQAQPQAPSQLQKGSCYSSTTLETASARASDHGKNSNSSLWLPLRRLLNLEGMGQGVGGGGNCEIGSMGDWRYTLSSSMHHLTNTSLLLRSATGPRGKLFHCLLLRLIRRQCVLHTPFKIVKSKLLTTSKRVQTSSKATSHSVLGLR